MTKQIEFKCPKCGYEWVVTVDAKAVLSARQRCPECRKYSDDCFKPFNAWSELKRVSRGSESNL